MSKKILLLLAGYIGGSIVSSLYSSKKGEDLKKDIQKTMKKGEDPKKVLFGNFLDTHKKFLDDMKEKVLTDERKDFFEDKKAQMLELVQQYKEEGEKMLQDFGKNGKGFSSDIYKEIEKFGHEKMKDGESFLQKVGVESFDDFKSKLKDVIEDLKKKIK